MIPDLVVFDCDGVLIDSEPIVNRAHAVTLAECGFAIGEAELLRRFCGLSDAAMLAAIAEEAGRSIPDFYRERVKSLVAREYRAALRSIAGISEVLAALTMPVCVASSGTPEQIRLGLECTHLIGFFEPHLFSATMVGRGKPAPDLFLHAAARMGAAPERCLVVEDSEVGVAAAVAAGMTAIGFIGGSHCLPGHAERLRRCGAAAVIAAMRDLPRTIAMLGPPAGR